MESQPHQQLSKEDTKKHLNAILHRRPDDRLDNLLRSENDTLFDTKSFPAQNFYAGSHYGAAGPSSATLSRSISDGVFSTKFGALTDATSYTPSSKGKRPARRSLSSSIGANKGSSTDDGPATSSGSDTDQTKALSVKDTGSSFKPGDGKEPRRDKKRKQKVTIVHGKLKLGSDRIDAHASHQYQATNSCMQGPSDSDLEAHPHSKVTIPKSDLPPWSYKTTMISLTILGALLGLLAALLYIIVSAEGQHKNIICPILAILLIGTVSASISAIIMAHGENSRAAKCAFTIGMIFASIIASMLALSIGRPNVECYLIMVAIFALAVLLRPEIDTIRLLKWK